MLLRVLVENFKAVDRFEAELSGATAIVGPVGSGKTSILEAVSLLMQSRGEPWLLVEGPLVMFHAPMAVVRRRGSPRGVGVWWMVDGEVLGYVYRIDPVTSHVRQELYVGDRLVAAAERRGDRGAIVEPEYAELCTAPFAVMSEDAYIPCGESRVAAEAERVAMRLRVGLRDRFVYLSEKRFCTWKRTYETLVDLLPSMSVGSDAQYVIHQLSRALMQGGEQLMRRIRYVFGVSDVRVGLAGSGRLDAALISGGVAYPSIHAASGIKHGLPILVAAAIAPEGATLAIDSVFEGLDEDTASRLLGELLDVARERRLQLLVTERSRWGAKLLEGAGFKIVYIRHEDRAGN